MASPFAATFATSASKSFSIVCSCVLSDSGTPAPLAELSEGRLFVSSMALPFPSAGQYPVFSTAPLVPTFSFSAWRMLLVSDAARAAEKPPRLSVLALLSFCWPPLLVPWLAAPPVARFRRAKKDSTPLGHGAAAFPVPEALRSDAEVLRSVASMFCTKLP